MPLDKSGWDPYFHWSQAGYRLYYSARKIKGVTVEEVTCKHCPYITSCTSIDPRKAFRAHMKNRHPREYWRTVAKDYVIHEEDDLVFVAV